MLCLILCRSEGLDRVSKQFSGKTAREYFIGGHTTDQHEHSDSEWIKDFDTIYRNDGASTCH